jgi:uncharacterized protein (TIGR00290 family)
VSTGDGFDRATLACCSFSGGKDSCMALYEATRAGLDVQTLVMMFDDVSLRSKSHGVPRELAQAQARALGKHLVAPVSSWKSYEREFTAVLRDLSKDGYMLAVFGDIDLQAHRDWEAHVCAQAGLRPVLPLWQRDRKELAMEFIALGFKATVVCVDSKWLSDEFCGREFDQRFIADLPAEVDACGENGEFHTFVHDGPLFSHSLRLHNEGSHVHVGPAEFGSRRYCFARLVEQPESESSQR